MKLTKQRAKEKAARDLIYKALREYHEIEPDIPAFEKDRIPAARYHEELTMNGIDSGVVALLLINNMSGGSADDVDLYNLLHKYLLNKAVRKQINQILKS